MTELRPCPFCGGEAKVWVEYIHYGNRHVYDEMNEYHCGCEECGISMSSRATEEDAIKDWNRRANND